MLKIKKNHVKFIALLVFIVNPSFGSDITERDMDTIQPPLSSISETENDFVPPPPKLRRQSGLYKHLHQAHNRIPIAYTSEQYTKALTIFSNNNIHSPTLQEVHTYITLEKHDPLGRNSAEKEALITSILKREKPLPARL